MTVGSLTIPTRKPEITPAAAPRTGAHRDLASLIGPPALLEGEDGAAYDELTVRFRSAIEPADVIEEIWVRDIVDLVWETIRLRRWKAKIMQAAAHEGLARLLTPHVPAVDLRDLVNRWSRRDPVSRKKVDALLKKAGLDQDAIAAQTLAVRLDTFDKIDTLLTKTEARRNLILREVNRHRDFLDRRPREMSAAIDEPQFSGAGSAGGETTE
jgi:hypothetical protein